MRSLILFLVLVAGACGKAPEPRKAETDPAVADALADPIMADPQLALQQGQGAQIGVPVGAMPDMGQAMPTLGQVAKVIVKQPAFAGCDIRIRYSYAWMARLPAGLALPAGSQVSEAAGSDGPRCALRIVRFGMAKSPVDSLDHWRKLGRDGGFAIKGDDTALTGIRERDGAAFQVTARAAGSGAMIDLAVNRGG